MYLGLQMPSFTFDGLPSSRMFERIADTAIAAEASGFDSFWVMDHYHQIANVGPKSDPMLECNTILAGVAARTSTISVGALVCGVHYRNPAFLAKAATTLDIVSSGRAILGIGAGWNEQESRAYGYEWTTYGYRFEELRDALEICRRMFTQERSSYHGKLHSIENAYNVPQPVQQGGPRIMIGGGGERKTLRLAAEFADMWNGFGDPATIRRKVEILEAHCRDVGRDPGEITKTRLGTIIVAEDDEEVERRRRAWQEDKGVSDADLPSRLVFGTPGSIGAAVAPYLVAGLDGMIFNMPVGSTPRDVEVAGHALRAALGTP
jgi:F420-dependent oxidoreductase-like protein